MGIGRKQLTVAGSIAQALNVEFKTRQAGPQGKGGKQYKKGARRENMRQNSEPRVQDARSLGFKFDPHGHATACRDVGVIAVFSV